MCWKNGLTELILAYEIHTLVTISAVSDGPRVDQKAEDRPREIVLPCPFEVRWNIEGVHNFRVRHCARAFFEELDYRLLNQVSATLSFLLVVHVLHWLNPNVSATSRIGIHLPIVRYVTPASGLLHFELGITDTTL